MKLLNTHSFSIENFEGPLDLLWQLIQRNEVDIYEVPLNSITKQYLTKANEKPEHDLDEGAEFIASAAALVLLKSKTLLPKSEQLEAQTEDEYDPRFEVIHQLIDYCRFRQAAKELTVLEQQQNSYYVRGVEECEIKKKLGINHLSLSDLASMFQEVLTKAQSHSGTIHEEEWRVSDKTKLIRHLLKKQISIPFGELFNGEKSREELIVTFLALLELMKLGEARVAKDAATQIVSILQPLTSEIAEHAERN